MTMVLECDVPAVLLHEPKVRKRSKKLLELLEEGDDIIDLYSPIVTLQTGDEYGIIRFEPIYEAVYMESDHACFGKEPLELDIARG